MAEPKIDPNWNRRDHIRIRPFLVAGIPISLIIIAIVLTFFQQSRELGKQGAKAVYDPAAIVNGGFVYHANQLLEKLLTDTMPGNEVVSDLESLNRKYRALTFALPYGEESKSFVEASDLRLVGINAQRITDPKDRIFFYNSRLPQLLLQQRQELSETFFRIRTKGLPYNRNLDVRPLQLKSLQVIPSMFKVALTKDPWTGVIRCAPNSLFSGSNVVYVCYGTSVLPLPVQTGNRIDVNRTIAYRADLSNSTFFQNDGRPVDYYQHYQDFFRNNHLNNAIKINLHSRNRGGNEISMTLGCQGSNLYIVPNVEVKVFSPTRPTTTINAHLSGTDVAQSVPVEDGMKLIAYDSNGHKLGEFSIYIEDPTLNLSQLIQTNVGLQRYTIPANRTDLFTQQLVQGLSRNLSNSSFIDTVQVTIDPLFSQAFERELKDYLENIERNFSAPANQRHQEFDISMTVMDLSTGNIIATPYYTTRFHQNEFSDKLRMAVRNPALSRRYIGSTFKPMITLASLLTNSNLINLNTAGRYHLNGQRAVFFGRDCRAWANSENTITHWNGSRLPCFLSYSDDVYPVALAALAMSGRNVNSDVSILPINQDNGFFTLNNNQNLVFKRSSAEGTNVDINTHPFTKWITYLYAANYKEEYTTDTLLFKRLYALRDANRAKANLKVPETDEDRSFGIESLCPDITNLHIDDFLQGGDFFSTLVPWVLGQGNNQWSCIKVAEAWCRMLSKRNIQASFIVGKPDTTLLSDVSRDPVLSTASGHISSREINSTWNNFLRLFNQAQSDIGQDHPSFHHGSNTLAAMRQQVVDLNNNTGSHLHLFSKTGTPDTYSRYEVPLLGGNNRQIDLGMYTFALIEDSEFNRIQRNSPGHGIVCVIRVTRTYECRNCNRSPKHVCDECKNFRGLGSSEARNFIANARRLRKFYDMTRMYY